MPGSVASHCCFSSVHKQKEHGAGDSSHLRISLDIRFNAFYAVEVYFFWHVADLPSHKCSDENQNQSHRSMYMSNRQTSISNAPLHFSPGFVKWVPGIPWVFCHFKTPYLNVHIKYVLFINPSFVTTFMYKNKHQRLTSLLRGSIFHICPYTVWLD